MADILARMRQLIGVTDDWADQDLVIGDGEIALERTDDGGVRMKIGNGVDTFSELPYFVTAAFGEDYTWRSVARSDAATYTAPDHPIMVNVHVQFAVASGSVICSVEGLQVVAMLNGGNGEMHMTGSFIVPPGQDYTIDWDSITAINVRELRAD